MINYTIMQNIAKARSFSQITRNFYRGKIIYNKQGAAATSGSSGLSGDVPGLGENCLKVPTGPVGPGATKDSDYKNPEYYCYNRTSYFEAEIEMLKYRCPQPSVHEYYKQPGADK